jgi:hypothetical protein
MGSRITPFQWLIDSSGSYQITRLLRRAPATNTREDAPGRFRGKAANVERPLQRCVPAFVGWATRRAAAVTRDLGVLLI